MISSASPSDYVMPSILILGIGNILLRDEGVGVRVVEAMKNMPLPADAELVDGGTAGADLIDLLADRRKVIVIDAIDAEAEPGAVFRLCPDDIMPQGDGMISLHQLGLVESLAMTARLGCAPKETVIFGIQPKIIGPGMELTAELQDAVPMAVKAVLQELEKS